MSEVLLQKANYLQSNELKLLKKLYNLQSEHMMDNTVKPENHILFTLSQLQKY